MLITASAAKCEVPQQVRTIASTAAALVGGLHDGVCDLCRRPARRAGHRRLDGPRSGRDLSLRSVERHTSSCAMHLGPPSGQLRPLSAGTGDSVHGRPRPVGTGFGNAVVEAHRAASAIDGYDPAAKRPRKPLPVPPPATLDTSTGRPVASAIAIQGFVSGCPPPAATCAPPARPLSSMAGARRSPGLTS